MDQSYDIQDLSQMDTSRSMSSKFPVSLLTAVSQTTQCWSCGKGGRVTRHPEHSSSPFSSSGLVQAYLRLVPPRMLVPGSTRQQLAWESFGRCSELIGDQLETTVIQERHDLGLSNPKKIPVGQ
jgi:hypothetical protein